MKNTRILAKDLAVSNVIGINSLNNNDVIIGPSGGGKTRGYVLPNILECNHSMIIADTKGNLHDIMKPILENKGYDVISVNLKDIEKSDGYNPIDFIHLNNTKTGYNEQHISTIAQTLFPDNEGDKDPFWINAARMYFTCFLSYVLETLPKFEHNLGTVIKIISTLDVSLDNVKTNQDLSFFDISSVQNSDDLNNILEKINVQDVSFKQLISALENENPNSYAVRIYKLFSSNEDAERMHRSIIGIMNEKFSTLILSELLDMYKNERRISFEKMNDQKTAVFLTISDTDRSMDRLVSLFYTQAIQELCAIADSNVSSKLKTPVRFIFDDFATNTIIDDFDNIISVIRSRNIYFSIILQSISQLDSIYGVNKASTIINNCDTLLYLGGQDIKTIELLSLKANVTFSTMAELPVSEAYLYRRGELAQKVTRYDVSEHPDFPEFMKSQEALKDIKNNKQSTLTNFEKCLNSRLPLNQILLKNVLKQEIYNDIQNKINTEQIHIDDLNTLFKKSI